MQAHIVPWYRGARWLGEGWQLFRGSPFGWLSLVLAYWLLMTFVSFLPLVGVVVASVLVPVFSVGFMAASRSAARSGGVALAHLFEGFQRNVPRQLILGAIYFVLLGVILGTTTLADGGALARWMLAAQRPGADQVGTDGFLVALLVAMCLYVPVMMMYWFAPLLTAWHDSGPAKALFFSFFACFINWRAFLAYGVVTAMTTMVIPFFVLTALLLASGGAMRVPVVSLVFPLLIVILPVLFASFYVSYRDVFRPEDTV